MKLARLIDEQFHVVLAKLEKEPLPLKTAFKLKGIIKLTREEYTKYDEVRQQALQKYGKKNEDGTLLLDERQHASFDEEGMKGFAGEISELTNMEIDVPTITLTELGDKVVVTAQELASLEGLIVE